MPDTYTLHGGNGETALSMLDEITELYLHAHQETDQDNEPLYHQDAFLTRTRNQTQRDGFTIVWARSHRTDLVGFCFGVPLGEGQWWTGNASPPPPQILAAPKFAVIELIVRHDWRGRGLGRHLLDELLRERPEQYATLTTRTNTPARRIYAQWGWEQVGTAQHTPEAPIMDQLVLRRTHSTGT
ncbi:MAG: GNAT family N-acetyltransferase [Pseudonocardiaceae bacterium]